MISLSRHLRWLLPTGVLLLAAALRLWQLDAPHRLVFDEIYYVRDAISQLAHGFPTQWPDDDPAFADPSAFTADAAPIAHPPLGKWLIGLGVLLFGAESAWGWRIVAAVAGITTVGLTMRLGWMMTRSLAVAVFAGLMLAVDGTHIAMSRVGLLDVFLTLFIVLGAVCIWQDQAAGGAIDPRAAAPLSSRARPERGAARLGPALWRRPWLLAAGAVFGAAAAVKWSGLYALAALLVLIVMRDLVLRTRIADRPILGSARQALITAAIALPAAGATYLATWLGWILNPGASWREPGTPWWVSLWEWHAHTLSWHVTLSAEHPYAANPWGWPLALRPTGMYWSSEPELGGCPPGTSCVAAIGTLPNPLVTWAGVAALLLLLWIVVRAAIRVELLRRSGVWVAAFVLTGYLSGWVPWLITSSRSAVFHFYAVALTPFSALALGLILAAVSSSRPSRARHTVAAAPDVATDPRSAERPRGGSDPGALIELAGIRLARDPRSLRGRRAAVAIFLSTAVLLGLLFYPLWSAMPVPEWFWRAHLWLPGWH